MEPFFEDARYTTADFFPMFEVPFLYGHGWNATDDEASARVTVLTRELNDKLFGGTDSTGQTSRMDDVAVRLVGVLDSWRPTAHFLIGRAACREREFANVSLTVVAVP